MTLFEGRFSGHSLTFPSFLFICLFIGNDVALEFDFGTLPLSGLKLIGDAHMSNGSVRLTRDLTVPNSGSGKVLYAKPVTFVQPFTRFPVNFSTFFSFSVTNLNPSSIGGGLAFVITPDDSSLGEAGGYLGVMDFKGTLNGAVVAVEFDTLMDVEFEDINGNHVGLDLNSMVSTQVGDLETVGVDLKSGDLVNSWIDYTGSTRTLDVFVSYSNLKPKDPVFSTALNIEEYMNDDMFVGFSGSTQGSTEIHSIEWWSFSSSSFDVNPKSNSASAVSSPPPPSSANNASSSSPPSAAPSYNGNVNSSSSGGKCHSKFCKQGGPGAVVGVVTAGAFFLALCALLLIWVYSKKLKNAKNPETLAKDVIKMPKEFSYKELKLATRGFDPDSVIGHGAFGTVYKGILSDSGDMVAVKRCSHTGQGKEEFLSELSIIGTLRHRNLVRLQGWCHEKGEILLVYDLMRNGSLDKVLFESRMVLPWHHRRKILLGVASALAYLHQECENQVIHRDIKSSNIMLDEAFNARLGDFGLARQVEHDKSPDATVAAGTMGYFAPEYLLTGRSSEKTDVFSFGAVVLEVASGRRPIEKEVTGGGGAGKVGGSVNANLVEWVWSLHKEGRVLAAADSRLYGEFEEGDMMRVLQVGLACSHPDPMARPTMRNVVQMLVGEAEVPLAPRVKPSMSYSTSQLLLNLQDSVSDLTLSISSSECSFAALRDLV